MAAATPTAHRYQVKAIFGPTLQGEGLHAGAPCVFLRLAGCNAWDGRAETRANSACPYCDTDFRGGELLDMEEIVLRLEKASCVLRPRKAFTVRLCAHGRGAFTASRYGIVGGFGGAVRVGGY